MGEMIVKLEAYIYWRKRCFEEGIDHGLVCWCGSPILQHGASDGKCLFDVGYYNPADPWHDIYLAAYPAPLPPEWWLEQVIPSHRFDTSRNRL